MQRSPRGLGYHRSMGATSSNRRSSTVAVIEKPRLPVTARPMVPSSANVAALHELHGVMVVQPPVADDELSSIQLEHHLELEDAVDPFLSPPLRSHHLAPATVAAAGGMMASGKVSSTMGAGCLPAATAVEGNCDVASPSTYQRLGRLRAERIEQLRREEDELRRWLADIEVSPAQPQGAILERASPRVYQAPPVNAAPQPPLRKPLVVITASPTASEEASERAAAKESRRRARPERFKFTSFDITRSRELQDLLWSFSPISGPPSFRLLPGTTLTTVIESKMSAATPAASGAKSFSFGASSVSDTSSAAGTCTSNDAASPRPSLTSLFVPPPGYTGPYGSASSVAGAMDSPSQLQVTSPVSFTIPPGLAAMRSPGMGKSPAGGATGAFDPSPKHSRVSSFRLLRPRPLAMHSEDDEDEAERQQQARDRLKKEVIDQQRRLETLADNEDEPDRVDRDDDDDNEDARSTIVHEEDEDEVEDEEDEPRDDDEEQGEIASEDDDDEERLARMVRRRMAEATGDRRGSNASTQSVASPRSPSTWHLTIQPGSPRSATGNGNENDNAGQPSKSATPTSTKSIKSTASPSSVVYHLTPSASPPNAGAAPAGRAFAAGNGVNAVLSVPVFMTPASSADLSAAAAAASAALASVKASPRSAAIIASAFTNNPSPRQPRRRSILTPRSSRAAAVKYPPPPSVPPPPPPPPASPPMSPTGSPRAFLSLAGGAHRRSSSRVPQQLSCVGSISLSPHATSLPFSFSLGGAEELVHKAPTPVAPPTPNTPPPPPPPDDDDEDDVAADSAPAAPAFVPPRGPPPVIDRATYARALARRERRERAVKRLAHARSNNQHVEIEVRMLGS